MDDLILKIVTTLGVPGLSIYLIYRLLDRYAGKMVEHAGRFVDASIRQSAATTELVATVRLASADQRDVLLAVRSMSTELAALKGWVKEIEAPAKS